MTVENTNKICFFLPSFRTGGSEKIFIELSNYLFKFETYEIVFICVNAKGKLKSLLNKKIKIIDLKCNSVSKSILSLVKIIKTIKPNLIISSMTHCNVTLLIAKIISFSKSKVIIRECASIEQIYPFKFNKPKYLIIRLMIRILYRFADYVISNSKDLAFYLKTKFNIKKVEVIYNGYDINEINRLSLKKPKIKFSKSYKYIIAVARISQQKGLDTLIKAFKIVNQKINCKLIVLGEGEVSYKKKIENLAKELNIFHKIHFLGYQYNPYKYIKRSDVFVLSSRVEGLPGALIQALVLGVNIVSTDSNYGPREVLKNGKLGRLVPVNDEKLLAIEILELLYNPYKIPHPNKLDIRRFDMEIIAKKYKTLFNQILKSNDKKN